MVTQVVAKAEEPGSTISNNGQSLPSPGQRGTKGKDRFVEPTRSAVQMESSECIWGASEAGWMGAVSWKSNPA